MFPCFYYIIIQIEKKPTSINLGDLFIKSTPLSLTAFKAMIFHGLVENEIQILFRISNDSIFLRISLHPITDITGVWLNLYWLHAYLFP